MKYLSLFIAFVFSIASFAQNNNSLEKYIPQSASMVIKLNGQALTTKVGMDKIAKSDAFLNLLRDEIFLGNDKTRVTEIGIDLQKDVYVMYKRSEDITYTAYLYEISNPTLFGKYIAEKNEFVETQKNDDFTTIFYKNDSYYNYTHEEDMLAWNNKYAVYIDVIYARDYPLVSKDDNTTGSNEMLENDVQVEEAADAIEAADAVSEAAEAAGEAVEEAATDSYDYYEERRREREERRRVEDSLKELEQIEKVAIMRGIYDGELKGFFAGGNAEASIMGNKAYVASKNTEADVSFWMDLRNASLTGRMYDYGYYGRRYDAPGMFAGFLGAYAGKELNAHLFFNKNDISIESNIEFLPQVSELLAGVYGTSLPKGYLKYISTEKVLGITSASINSVKFWEAFPSIMADAYMMTSYRGADEKEQAGIRMLVDFASIVMDEEAMGELMTGDVVMVLKDLVPTEVKYFTYEYNADYSESKRVEKTKTEMYPDFLLMFGSEKRDFMTKFLDFAVKNEALYRSGNYYYTEADPKDLPFQLYFALTDDMAFISTDLNEIQNLANGNTKGKLNKEVAKKMRQNSSYFALSLAELLSRFPKEDLRQDEAKLLNFFTENGGEIEWFNNYKNGKSVGQMQMKTPAKYNNSAQFLWDFIEMTGSF